VGTLALQGREEVRPLYISIARWDSFERELRIYIGVESGIRPLN